MRATWPRRDITQIAFEFSDGGVVSTLAPPLDIPLYAPVYYKGFFENGYVREAKDDVTMALLTCRVCEHNYGFMFECPASFQCQRGLGSHKLSFSVRGVCYDRVPSELLLQRPPK